LVSVKGKGERADRERGEGRERADRCFGFGHSLLPTSPHRDRRGLLLLLLFCIFHTSGSLEDIVEGQESELALVAMVIVDVRQSDGGGVLAWLVKMGHHWRRGRREAHVVSLTPSSSAARSGSLGKLLVDRLLRVSLIVNGLIVWLGHLVRQREEQVVRVIFFIVQDKLWCFLHRVLERGVQRSRGVQSWEDT
jgi:hypothetical protein